MNPKVLLTELLLLLALGTVACDDPGSQAEQAPAPVVSEATLPTLTLTHGGRAVDARRFEGCWRPDPSADLQCVGTSPRGELGNYLEVESGDIIRDQDNARQPSVPPAGHVLRAAWRNRGRRPSAGFRRSSAAS